MSEMRDGDTLCDVCLQAAPPGGDRRGRELKTETEMRERSGGGGGGGRVEQPTAGPGLGTQTAETADASCCCSYWCCVYRCPRTTGRHSTHVSISPATSPSATASATTGCAYRTYSITTRSLK